MATAFRPFKRVRAVDGSHQRMPVVTACVLTGKRCRMRSYATHVFLANCIATSCGRTAWDYGLPISIRSATVQRQHVYPLPLVPPVRLPQSCRVCLAQCSEHRRL